MKLPDITYGRASSPSGGPGPQVAVRAAAERQQIVNAGFKAAEEVGTAYREFELRKHDAEYQNEMSDFRMKAATMKVATPAEIKALGLDDVIDTEGKEFIPKSEWYPVALERMMEQSKEKYASRIKSPVDRTKWTQEMDNHNNQILLRETQMAAKESEEHLKQMKQADIAADIDDGNYTSALIKLNENKSSFDPVEFEKLKTEIEVSEAQHLDMEFRRTASPSELRERAVEMRSREYVKSDPRSAEELDSAANTMESLAKLRESEAEKAEKDAYDNKMDAYWRTFGGSPSEMVANMPADVEGKDYAQIMNWANTVSQRGDVITDSGLYMDIYTALSTDPQGWFAQGNRVQDFRTQLSRADSMKLLDMQEAALSNNGEPPPSLRTYTQRLASTYGLLGIDAKKQPEKAYAINQIAENMISAKQHEKGRELSPEETQGVFTEINRMAKSHNSVESFLIGMGVDAGRFTMDVTKTLADIDEELDVTEHERMIVTRALATAVDSSGNPIQLSPAAYYDAVRKLRQKPRQGN